MRRSSESPREQRSQRRGAPVVVGSSDCGVARLPATFITHGLGSCIGLCLYDAEAGVRGLLHILLPSSRIDTAKAVKSPFTFADTGIRRMLADMERLGARRGHIVAKMAGGAAMMGCPTIFDVGRRNVASVRQTLRELGVRVVAAEVGGSISRTMTLDANNTMIVRTPGRSEVRR